MSPSANGRPGRIAQQLSAKTRHFYAFSLKGILYIHILVHVLKVEGAVEKSQPRAIVSLNKGNYARLLSLKKIEKKPNFRTF
jgi:hypothetical protein